MGILYYFLIWVYTKNMYVFIFSQNKIYYTILSLCGELSLPGAIIFPEDNLPEYSSETHSTLNKLSSLFPRGFKLLL